MKEYEIEIVLGYDVIYTIKVKAWNKEQAYEFAYDEFERESYARVKESKDQPK